MLSIIAFATIAGAFLTTLMVRVIQLRGELTWFKSISHLSFDFQRSSIARIRKYKTDVEYWTVMSIGASVLLGIVILNHYAATH